MKNYEKIKSSIEEAISEESQLDERLKYDAEDELYINNIRKSKLKSIIIIANIDRALEVVRAEYYRKAIQEKYETFIDCLMYGMSYEDATIKFFLIKNR